MRYKPPSGRHCLAPGARVGSLIRSLRSAYRQQGLLGPDARFSVIQPSKEPVAVSFRKCRFIAECDQIPRLVGAAAACYGRYYPSRQFSANCQASKL